MKKLISFLALMLTVCSTAMAEVLNDESAVGTIGTLNGREAMVVDLGGSIGKVAVATRNVGATDVNDYGTSFSAEDALDPDKNGLTGGWYVPSMEELVALSENLKDNDDKDSKYGLEWQVSETATLYVPATILIYGEYGGFYMSSSQSKSILAFIYDATKGLTKMVVDNQVTTYPQFAIRPFHKLPTTYVYPVYNDPDDVTKGVKDWETETVSAIEVTSSTEPVTLGERWTTTWYVVTGKDVTLSQGAICYGNVNLILADDAKLTATGADDKAGITTATDFGNSLTIYGQTAQSGQLEANGGIHGAGIGGGNNCSCAEITINGGTVTANGGDGASGIGGGYYGFGSDITINGGKVTATGINATGIGGGYYGIGSDITINGGTVRAYGGGNAAGIGGGLEGKGFDITINDGTVTAIGGESGAGIGGGHNASGFNITIIGGTVTANGGEHAAGIGGGCRGLGQDITINGGTVTANDGSYAAGIGGGYRGFGQDITINGGMVTATSTSADGIGSGSEGKFAIAITVATTHIVKADGNNPPTTVIENNGDNLAFSLAGKQYVTITEPYFNITANQDPNHETYYYSTFYSRTCDYQVPSGVTAYTGTVDGSVLKLTAIADGIIPTGEAVILRLTSEEDITATKQQFDLTAMTTTTTKSKDNKLSGTDVAKTLGENEYALSLGQYGVGFYLWKDKEIGANKAYLTLESQTPTPTQAKAFTFMFDDGETTAIEQPAINGKQSGDTYNLNGVRVNDNYKGIVIKNGKKVYQK